MFLDRRSRGKIEALMNHVFRDRRIRAKKYGAEPCFCKSCKSYLSCEIKCLLCSKLIFASCLVIVFFFCVLLNVNNREMGCIEVALTLALPS